MIESINLNLIPSGVSPVCHVSQYDAGRQIKINLFEGINPYTIQSGDAFTLNVRKPDNTIVTTSVSGTQGDNYITISTTEQIAAVVGENLCELKITNGSTVIGTLNFIMQVERDVLADGIPSQSVIEDLDERIAEAIGDNYYNKTETDDLLNDKADKSNTYTKTETDSLLALKADKSDTYTKTETDALLALKADKSELYNAYPTEQESGGIASFTDGAENIPVKALVSEIVAVESGSGEKSPSNPYTISGFASGIVTRCGKNLLNLTATTTTISGITYTISDDGTISTSGVATAQSSLNLVFNITLKESMILSGCATGGAVATFGIQALNANSTSIVAIDYGNGVTLPAGTYGRIRITFQNGANANGLVFKPMLRLASVTDSTYEKYNGNNYTFAFGQTVYGGHFDNKGNLVVTRGELVLSSLNWYYSSNGYFEASINIDCPTVTQWVAQNGNCGIYTIVSMYFVTNSGDRVNNSIAWYSNVIRVADNSTTDVSTFISKLQNQSIYYELANPIVLSITSQDIPSLLGENNIFSNTGDVDVTIRADIGLYIDKRLNANRSTPNNLSRAAAYVDDPESVNETQEDNVEPQNEER